MKYIWLHKKQLLWSAILSMSACGAAFGIDLGEMQVRSAPGEPLDATISIMEEDDLANISVDLATEKEFSKAVVGMTQEVHRLKFTTVKSTDGELYIKVTTRQPIAEEVVHFLIAVKTPNARVVREYVVIEENEIYATHAQPSVIELVMVEPEVKLPLPYIALNREEAEKVWEEYKQPIAQQDKKLAANTSIIVTEKLAPVLQQSQYYVKAGDNLWHITQKLQNNMPSTNFYQLMAALYQLNPDAFIKGNVNLLRAGSSLVVPSTQMMRELDLRNSMQHIRAQMTESAIKPTRTVAPVEKVETTATVTTAGKPAELKILTPQPGKEELTAEQIGAMTDQEISTNLALINEELAKVHRNNETVLERIQALQTQINTLQKLLTLREQEQGITTEENAPTASEEPLTQTLAAVETPPSTPEVTESAQVSTEAETSAESETSSIVEIPTEAPAEMAVATEIPIMPKSMADKTPSVEEPAILAPELEVPKLAEEGKQAEQKVNPKQWLNYLILAILVFGAVLAIVSLKRRKKVNLTTDNSAPEYDSSEQPMPYESQETEYPKEQVQEGTAQAYVHPEEEDKVAAKLELAKAYFDLGDKEGAMALLQEVLWEGTAQQREAAQAWLDKLDEEKTK